MEISQKIRDEIKHCQFSAVIHLPNYHLLEFPSKLLTNAVQLQMLRRLDLSFNRITEIPSGISELTELRELWLQHNLLLTLPAVISNCVKLELIDLKATKITEPCRDL
jgi:Leucine-rich repeat (LRR) protein